VAFREPRESVAVGVGTQRKAPPPVSTMRRAGLPSRYDRPHSIIPHRLQVTEHAPDVPMRSSSEACDVLQPRDWRSYLADDAGSVRPSVARIISGTLRTGDTEGLAWEASGEHINVSPPLVAREGSHVTPDGRRIEQPVCHPSREHIGRIRLPLDGADKLVAEQS
jgi:hypothetical protein